MIRCIRQGVHEVVMIDGNQSQALTDFVLRGKLKSKSLIH